MFRSSLTSSSFSRNSSNRMSSSSSSSSSSNSPKTKASNTERELLLSATIVKIYLGTSRIALVDNLREYSAVNFALGLCNFKTKESVEHHSLFIELRTKKNVTYKIVLEYGDYGEDEQSYGGACHYWKRDGLRFFRCALDQFEETCNSIQNFSICGSEMTLEKLLSECCKTESWTKNDYYVTIHNCQDFAKVALKKCQASSGKMIKDR